MDDALSLGSVFSGIGGIDAGLEACGLRVLWQCERDPFRRAVLRKQWPNVEIHDDARDLRDAAHCDVLAGGSPCQDLAAHGSGLGLHGSRSGLWWAYVGAIERIRPRIVFFENVANVLRSREGQDFAAILGSLSELGFDARWGVFRGTEAGLSHRRRRLFLLAYTGEGRRALQCSTHHDDGRVPLRDDADGRGTACDAPPGPDDIDALRAWAAHDGHPQPGLRRDLAGIPGRMDRVAALGDAAPPAMVALAWRTLRCEIVQADG